MEKKYAKLYREKFTKQLNKEIAKSDYHFSNKYPLHCKKLTYNIYSENFESFFSKKDRNDTKDETIPSPIKSILSSAALAINTFGQFKDNDIPFFNCDKITVRGFEETFPTGVKRGGPINIDILLSNSNQTIYVESKFDEVYQKKRFKISDQYQDLTLNILLTK